MGQYSNHTSRLRRDQRGAINILFALLLLPLIGLVGMAIDSSRAYAVKLRLQESIDSAALVAAKNYSDTNRDQMIQDYFDENWRDGFMNTAAPALTFTTDATTRSVTITAQVTMPTIFMRLWGTPNVTVGTLTSSVSALTYLEIAVALDNTTSMRAEVSSGVRRIDAMKTAATNFVNTLFTEGGTLKDHIDNMWLSIVPFTNMVNVGSQHTDFLVNNSTNNILWDFPRNTTTQNSWRGCVFERSFYEGGAYAGRDMTEDNPSVEKFYPYHVVPAAMEVFTICKGPPPCPEGQDKCYDGSCMPTGTCPVAPPAPPSPPYTPPPPPPCVVDGFPCKAGGALPNKNLFDKPQLETTQVAVNLVQCDKPVSGSYGGPGDPSCTNSSPTCTAPQRDACEYYLGIGPCVRTHWTGYNISPVSLVYQTSQGIKFYYPSPNGDLPRGYNAAFPGYRDMSGSAAKNSSGVSVCCFGAIWGDNLATIDGWTASGRWIAPWPNATAPKLGGWGNSGCGLPVMPLQDDRTKLLAKINDMDVPPLRNPGAAPNHASNVPDLGYEGTIINQGLVWGWRTISENWQSYWKYENGSDIASTLPLDYNTSGSSKAVVVMTDGLNFMPDPGAMTSYGGPRYFGQPSIQLSFSDTNLSPSSGNINWTSVDSSAYGTLGYKGDGWAGNNTGESNSQDHCAYRRLLNMEPHLSTWGCKEYDSMLRNTANSVLGSGTGLWGPYTLTAALTGPYYDELTRRMLVTCTAMKARGVRIFFILFAIADNPQKAAALSAFNSCAGGNGGVYDAANATDLNNAFQAIAIRLRALRLQQ